MRQARRKGDDGAGKILENDDAFNEFVETITATNEMKVAASGIVGDGQPFLDFLKGLFDYILAHPELIQLILALFGL